MKFVLPHVLRNYRNLSLLKLKVVPSDLRPKEQVKYARAHPFPNLCQHQLVVPHLLEREEATGTWSTLLAGGLATSKRFDQNTIPKGLALFFEIADKLGIKAGEKDLDKLSAILTPQLKWFNCNNRDPYLGLLNLARRIEGRDIEIGNCAIQGWLFASFALFAAIATGEFHYTDQEHSAPFFRGENREIILWDYNKNARKFGLWTNAINNSISFHQYDGEFFLSGPFSFIPSIIVNRLRDEIHKKVPPHEHLHQLALLQTAKKINPFHKLVFEYEGALLRKLGLDKEADRAEQIAFLVEAFEVSHSNRDFSVFNVTCNGTEITSPAIYY